MTNYPKINLRIILTAFLAASLLLNIALFLNVRTLENDPIFRTRAENKVSLERVGRLMVLPEEAPTIATVTDPSQLKDQAFFARAKKGDKVLIFSQARKAVLYDPTADLIVDTAPINAGSPADAGTEITP